MTHNLEVLLVFRVFTTYFRLPLPNNNNNNNKGIIGFLHQ